MLFFTTLGKANPTACAPGSCWPSTATCFITASGAEGFGVGTWPSPRSLPVDTSTRPPLMEEPPTSMPRTFMRVWNLYPAENRRLEVYYFYGCGSAPAV